MFDLLVKNGLVVTERGVIEADVAVEGERIAGLFKTSVPIEARRVIDASKRYVLPGGIDSHVHFDMAFMGQSKHTFESGTIAAAFGGTTTVIDFTLDMTLQGLSPLQKLERRRKQAEGRAVVDYSFHSVISDGDDATLDQIGPIVEQGVPSFKMFTVYREAGLYVNDATLFNVMQRLRDLGGMPVVHTENADLVDYYTARLLAEGRRSPRDYPLSRPAVAEAECIRRTINLAKSAGSAVYIVHIAASEAVEAVRLARMAHQPVYGETCPHYLTLTEDMYSRPDGYNFIMSPPLRTATDNASLWEGLAGGWLSTVSSDDNSIDVEDKRAGQESFDRASPGCVDIETRMPLLFSHGVRHDRISLLQMAEVSATNPARIFGLYPRKGTIAPGSDADLVLIDPSARTTVSVESMHMQVHYSPYDGWELVGLPVMTISRGTVLVENGQFVGPAGHGQFLRRQIGREILREPGAA